MSQTVTLTLPDTLYAPIARIAQSKDESVEVVLLNALQASLPPVDGLPTDLQNELIRLETLDNHQLHLILLEQVPQNEQDALEDLLYKNQAEGLDASEQEKLAQLQAGADKVMLRKARSAVLLRFRGERLPTLAELRRLTGR